MVDLPDDTNPLASQVLIFSLEKSGRLSACINFIAVFL